MKFKEILRDSNNVLILVLLICLFTFSLWLRVLPLLNLGSLDILNIVGSDDPLYNLRQTEQILANYPVYNWFEVMTLYPTGQIIPWGPMLIWITGTFSLIAGAATRNEIISVALWVPPLFAALMVPLMFFLVRKIWDWKAGLMGAVLISVVGGQFFFRSLAGYLDHHILEVFFSTLFCLAYISTLVYVKKNPVDFHKRETIKIPLILSLITGITFILGFFTMPTIILFGFITAITTIILFIWDFYHDHSSDYLVLINTIVFGLTALASLLLGIQAPEFGLYLYSWGQPLSYLLLVIGTAVLYLLSLYLKGRNKLVFPAAVFGLAIIGLLALMLILPDMFVSFTGGLQVFLGFNPYAVTVQEARPWTIAEAWQVFNFGIILMIGGVLVLLYESLKKYRPEHIFILVWSLFIIIAAFRQIRYEYYLAVNIALLGGVCIGYSLERAWPDVMKLAGRTKKAAAKEPAKETAAKEESKAAKQKKKAQKAAAPAAKTHIGYANILVAGVICALAVIFAFTSVSYEYQIANSAGLRMNQDWRESLEWMNTNTPDPGVDYLKLYDKATFTYPPQSYGVMSWWDYGHMITYIARRIPNANPFQAGVAGPNGSAAFFISQSEETTNTIAENQGTRFVMTDIEMDTGKFWAMATWYNSSVGQGPYQKLYLVPDNPVNPTGYEPVTVYLQPYFMTTVSRLHNFDGSHTEPGQVYYIEYTDTAPNSPYPVIVSAKIMTPSEAKAAVDQYNQQAQPGYYATIVATTIVEPLETVPALRHYRLVHESPTNVFRGPIPDVKYVKVFEYVPGAKIKGEGVIELGLISNTGRQFVYRQASINGEFIVPYSTQGNPYEVKATGKYTIAGTGQQFEVSEDAVMQGAAIN